jgi:hypothetical protein
MTTSMIRKNFLDVYQRYEQLGFDIVANVNVDRPDLGMDTWLLASWEPGYKRVSLDGFATRADIQDVLLHGLLDDGADYDAATVPLLALNLTTGDRYALRARYDMELAGPFGNDFRTDGFTDGIARPVC